ncbi:hypothetical protein BD769DRAFT_1001206 [Suillus cothurnatus]|nr:hypothetical protein BD769DRAFT_1001206 [Suillus cothurnatus]
MSSRNNSRFSTLKVFKFNKERPPPPPPPKDDQYFQQGLQVQGGPYGSSKSLYNPSVTSLSPPTGVLPSLPTTPDYNRASPESTPSVRSFGPAMSIESEKSKRNIFKFSSMGKRNKSTRNLIETEDPEPPQEDEGISSPWNFQHHIHVDEGFVGLPPSWSNALSQAGFTDDEIAAIHARRTAVRGNPNALRPDSPLSILHHPAPRSSSLAARSSNATLIANAYINAPSPSSFNFPPFRQSSYTATSSSHSPSAIEGDTVDTQYVFVNGTGHESMIDPYPLDTQSVSTHHSSSNHSNTPQIARVQSEGPPRSNSGHVPSPLVHSRSLPLSHDPLDAHSIHSASPRTPPRRVFHVSNADESPPPAYHSPLHTSVFRDKPGFSSEGSGSGMEKESGQLKEKERDVDSILDISATTNTTSSSLYTDTDLSLPDVDPALLNRHMSPTPPLVIDKRLTKLGALPPRLSFHLSSDLGLEDWGAGLLTGLEDGSGSGGGSRLEDRLGLSKSGKFVESKRSSLLADRGEGSSSSLLPGFSLSSSSSPRPRPHDCHHHHHHHHRYHYHYLHRH